MPPDANTPWYEIADGIYIAVDPERYEVTGGLKVSPSIGWSREIAIAFDVTYTDKISKQQSKAQSVVTLETK